VTLGSAPAVHTSVATSARTVWQVLSDGFTYPAWVVGASHMRAVDDQWPAPGAALHYSFGAWPLVLRDTTEVVEQVPGRRLTLIAHGRPIGDARVCVEITPDDTDLCTVTMTEDAIGTPARLVPAAVRHRLIAAHNRESLARLAALCERRSNP
jgi:hypothetical protein